MNAIAWITEFKTQLESRGVMPGAYTSLGAGPAHFLAINAADWGIAAACAAQFGCRYAGMWGDVYPDSLEVQTCLVYRGNYLVLRTQVPAVRPAVSSHTPFFLAANHLEKHCRDLLGIQFVDHPDGRRWTRHQAWQENQFPLRSDFPQAGYPTATTPPDGEYPFIKIQGTGVYEIPVGPVHAGIIEPGHFRFQAVGEDVLRLELRLGYTHKGIEKIAVGRDAMALTRLAARVSGDSTVAHAWAACQAMERAALIDVPERALYLRAIMAERERVANHLWDIAAVCNDVSFAFMYYQCGRLKEQWQRTSMAIFGHRLMMDLIIPGGVRVDITDSHIDNLQAESKRLLEEIEPLIVMVNDQPSLEDRLIKTGILTADYAKTHGVLGYVGKASGHGIDVRRDSPYAPYDLHKISVPVFQEGDVAARLRVRGEEIRHSLLLIKTLLNQMPAGELCTAWRVPPENAAGLGMVEGWRGEIITYVRFGANGRVERFFPRDPSWFSWPALEQLIHGNIVPDFPVCNKSVNGSYSGHDL